MERAFQNKWIDPDRGSVLGARSDQIFGMVLQCHWSRVLTFENSVSRYAWNWALGRSLARLRMQGIPEAAAGGDFGVVCGSFDAVGAAISAAGRP